MENEKLIETMIHEKAENDNVICLIAYANGLYDMKEKMESSNIEPLLYKALRLAKDMMIANDIHLPRTMEIMDEAISAYDSKTNVDHVEEFAHTGTYVIDAVMNGDVIESENKIVVITGRNYNINE